MASKRKKTPAADAKALRPGLEKIREQIDAVDVQIHQLINTRAQLARQVGISKHQDGHTVDFYRPERLAQHLRLFREIMSACLAQERPLKVAFLGPEGTFTQAAVLKHFGHSVRALALPSTDDVFQEVQAGTANFGVVPIENSSEGTVNNTLDRFISTSLHICGEVELRIHHYLIGRMKALEQIQRICAHPQALGQCRGWLDEHLPSIERVPVASNAEGARRARDERGTAAIAGETAAEIYGLEILAPQIEDSPDNTTRFLVIGPKLLRPSGTDKTTIMMSTGTTTASGSLFHLLEPLATHHVNMTRIESRPSRKRKWDYVFFIDIEGHAEDPPIAKALAALKKRASLFRVIGSYPRAIL